MRLRSRRSRIFGPSWRHRRRNWPISKSRHSFTLLERLSIGVRFNNLWRSRNGVHAKDCHSCARTGTALPAEEIERSWRRGCSIASRERCAQSWRVGGSGTERGTVEVACRLYRLSLQCLCVVITVQAPLCAAHRPRDCRCLCSYAQQTRCRCAEVRGARTAHREHGVTAYCSDPGLTT